MNFSLEALKHWTASRYFNSKREKFYEDLADAIVDRETLSKFISIRKTRAIKQRDPLAPLYAKWLNRLNKESGRLSYMLRGVAPASDILVLGAIEEKGELPQGLKFLARTIKDQRGMQASMRAAIAIPSLVATIMVIFMVILAVAVIPVFAELSPVEKWGGMGQVLHFISYVVVNWGLVIGPMIVGLLVLFAWSLPNWSGPRRAVFDKYLPYRVYRDYNGAVLLVALASMLKAGDSLNKALEQLKRNNTRWMTWHISRIIRNMDKAAGNYGEAFATGVFSQELTNRLIDYSRRSGEFEVVVARIGLEGIDQVKGEVDASAKKLNIWLVAILGGILAFMLVGVMSTAQGLSKGLKEEIAAQNVRR